MTLANPDRGPEMNERPVPDILDEWRQLELERDRAETAEARIRLDRRVAMLTVEYRDAMDAQHREAEAAVAIES